jgi:hypothetical protein
MKTSAPVKSLAGFRGVPGISREGRPLEASALIQRETIMTIRTSNISGASAYALAVCSTLAMSPAFAADFPTGTFQAKQTPVAVTFDDKGQFHANQGGTLEVAGNYTATASELKVTDVKGPWACTNAGEQTGTYTWKYVNAVLTLIKLADKCEDRVRSLVGPAWQLQK